MHGSNSNLCWFLRREENRGVRRKTLGAGTRTNTKLNPEGRNRTQAAMVRGERHCAISGFTRILREPLSPYVQRLRGTQFCTRYFSNKETDFSLRLVFTSDGVVVGVVIRSVERYDLVKIKPTESEAKHRFCLSLRRLRSSENCIVGATSRSRRIDQWQCSTPGLKIGWFFRFCYRLRQPSFHWIISEGVVNGIERNGNVLIFQSDSDSVELMTPLSTPIFNFH